MKKELFDTGFQTFRIMPIVYHYLITLPLIALRIIVAKHNMARRTVVKWRMSYEVCDHTSILHRFIYRVCIDSSPGLCQREILHEDRRFQGGFGPLFHFFWTYPVWAKRFPWPVEGIAVEMLEEFATDTAESSTYLVLCKAWSVL